MSAERRTGAPVSRRRAGLVFGGMLALGLGPGIGVAGAQTPPAAEPGAPAPAAGAPPRYVAPGGLPTGASHHRFADRFAAANTTGDGHLTLQQAQAAGMKGIVKNFDAIDADHKGYVTMGDVRAFHHARRAAAVAARTGASS